MDIEQAERLQQQIAQQRREERSSSKDVVLRTLESFRSEMRRDYNGTLDSVQTVIRTVDRDGNVRTSTIQGISGYSDESAIVRSNMRSRRRRAARIKAVIDEVEKILEGIRGQGRGEKPPANLKEHLAKLRASIPDDNEMELLSVPKSGKK